MNESDEGEKADNAQLAVKVRNDQVFHCLATCSCGGIKGRGLHRHILSTIVRF